MKLESMTVTPAIAVKWLERHWDRVAKGEFRQRPLSPTRVNRYAQALRDKQWRETPCAISFDTDDNLADGQHRLEAIRESGVSLPCIICTGLEPESIDAFDIGMNRSNAALLALKNGYGGYSSRYAGAVAAIGRIAYRGHTASPTFANVEFMLEKLNLKANIDAILNKSVNRLRDFQTAIVGPLAYYHTIRPGKAVSFADGLFNYETTKGSPVNLFLNWIKSGRWQAQEPGKAVHSYQRKMAGMCACIRAWDTNTEISRIVAQPEAVEWLADMNPKLRDWIREHVSQPSGKERRNQQKVQKGA